MADAAGAGDLAPMSERYTRPDWVRRLNAMADAIGADARRLVPLDAADLLDTVRADLGAWPEGDLGEPGWQRHFESLVAAIDAMDLHVVGRLMSRQELLRALRTRLLMTAAVDARPAILDERVAAPLIVTGPARSGTTILFELLGLDPELRAPTAWEALHPVPRPEDRAGDRRRAAAECEQELWADIQPEFAAIHELRSDLPVECVTLTMPSFRGSHWVMIAQLGAWVPDAAVDYAFHRRILQVMQHGAPEARWLLKTPGHLMTLDALFAAYPDAWLIQTHRDPARTMPSTVSTTAMVQWLRTDRVDLPALSAAIEGAFSAALNNTVEIRKSGSLSERFVDVHFQDLMKDPVSTIRAAYAQMGRPFTDAHAERIRAYLDAKPRGKFGTHTYTPEQWGYSAEGLHERLAPYIEHFGVALE